MELNCSSNKDLYFYTDSAGNKNPASTKPLSLKRKFPSLSEKVPGKDQPKQETPSKKPTTDPSGSSPKTQESLLAIRKRQRNEKQYKCLYWSQLSHQPQSVLSKRKAYGNTASQMSKRRLTYSIV